MVFFKTQRGYRGKLSPKFYFTCSKCGKEIKIGEVYYIRRSTIASKKGSEYWCVTCKEALYIAI